MASVIRNLTEKTKPILSYALNGLFPPRCPSCSVPVDMPNQFCHECFEKLAFISEPHCVTCGVPFDYDLGGDAECAQCLQSPPAYTKARAAIRYDVFSRKLVTSFKYADQMQRLPGYAALMKRAGAQLLEKTDYLIPVPLHRKRLLQRKFNQSAQLAHAVSDMCGVPVLVDALLRTEHTPPQASLERAERWNNVKGAFVVNPEYAEQLKQKTVMIIDDVMTTGATIDACSKALLKAQTGDILVLTLARTVLDD